MTEHVEAKSYSLIEGNQLIDAYLPVACIKSFLKYSSMSTKLDICDCWKENGKGNINIKWFLIRHGQRRCSGHCTREMSENWKNLDSWCEFIFYISNVILICREIFCLKLCSCRAKNLSTPWLLYLRSSVSQWLNFGLNNTILLIYSPDPEQQAVQRPYPRQWKILKFSRTITAGP